MRTIENVVCLENRKEILTYDFGCPKQVLFKQEEETWCAGIAWGEQVICACCGGIIPFDEIEEMEVFENYWVNFSEEIGGDFLLDLRVDEEEED